MKICEYSRGKVFEEKISLPVNSPVAKSKVKPFYRHKKFLFKPQYNSGLLKKFPACITMPKMPGQLSMRRLQLRHK